MLRQDTNSVWFYQHRKGVLGPVNSDELRFLALTGKVKPDTLIRAGGSEDWIEYSLSPAAFLPFITSTTTTSTSTSERLSSAAADAAPGDQPVSEAMNPTGGVNADNAVLPEKGDGTQEEKALRVVSGAAVVALMLLAAILISLWGRDSTTDSNNQVAGHSSLDQEELSGDHPGQSAGGTKADEAVQADASDGVMDAAEESSGLQKTNDNADSSEVSPEISQPASVPSEESQPNENEMVDEETALVENDPSPAEEKEAAADFDPDRFGVALAPKVEAKPPEKKAKPKASRTALQQSDLSARNGEGRQKAIEGSGGTVESERAVARALEWLRRIQRSDGSWDFEDVGEDAQPGQLHSPLGATAMATLCFLGSGSTTRTGPDQELVKRAFEFIISQEGTQIQGNDSMYVHALVTLCLTELVTMEPDEKKFHKQAADAVSYIERAQDPIGGGWRYTFQSPGDTSVTGWDVMALQSAQSGGMKVDPAVVSRAQSFLDSVSDSGGATYAYTPGSPSTPSMTAVGLLCRMYLGWPHKSGALREGIHRLSTIGVSQADMYYNYYATITLHHFGGTEWEKWNATMRDQLVASQLTEGPAAGSWSVTDPHGGSGGQIYQTCLSVLTLEVYYRYLPLYRP